MATRRQRAAKVVNDENDFESMEEEVVHLQRLFRLAEKDTKAYVEETKRIVLRQRKVIAKLEWDKEEILEKIRSDGEKAFFLARDKETVSALTGARSRLMETVKEEKLLVTNQDNEVRKIRQEIHRLNRNACRSKSATVTDDPVRRIKVLEDRMQTASVQLNGMLHLNTRSRENIEHLLKQLEKYSKIGNHLELELSCHRSEISRLTVDAAQAFEDRDRASSRLRFMRETGMKERAENQNQVKEIQRFLCKERQQVRFLTVKGFSQLTEEELRLDHDTRLRLMKKRREQTRKSVERYDAAMRGLRAISGKNHFSDIVEHYFHLKACNAAIFNFVSDLNNKVDALNEIIQDLRRDAGTADSSLGGGVSVSESETDAILTDTAAEGHMPIVDTSRGTSVRRVLKKVHAAVGNMVTIAYGQQDQALTPGEGNEDQRADTLTMLAIVEQRVNELLQICQFVKDQGKSTVERIKPKGPVLRPSLSANSAQKSPATVSSVDLVSVNLPSLDSETEMGSCPSPR